eukprot:994394-Pleurochrysis_carterae.AAC.2
MIFPPLDTYAKLYERGVLTKHPHKFRSRRPVVRPTPPHRQYAALSFKPARAHVLVRTRPG